MKREENWISSNSRILATANEKYEEEIEEFVKTKVNL